MQNPLRGEGFANGAGEATRTPDSHLGKVALYQLSYAREKGMSDYGYGLPAVN